MRKIASLLSVLMLLCTLAYAQNRTVTGTVRDENGNPVPFVTITETGTKNATTANADGVFSLSVGNNATLTFSAAGFQAQTVTPSGSAVNVSLVRGGGQLTEVVVTAVGISRAQKSLGYSTSTVRGEELTKARETNVVNSLAGKMSGVRVNSQSGTLGGSARIVIRGVNAIGTFSGPLFVIDGVPVYNNSPAGGTTATNVDYGNRAGDINPDDIETMTVLKGAAAAALYGSRARDGAIIITTKRGKKGVQASVSVNSSVRFDKPLKLPDFQNEYAQGNFGVYDLKYTNGWGPRISQVQDTKFKDFLGDSVYLQAQPNNVKDFFQTGVSHMNNVSVAGAGDNSDYRLSFTSMNEKGIIPETKLDRYTIALNSGREFSPKFSSRFSLSYTRTDAEGRPAQSSNNTNIITSSIYGLPRVVDINKLRNNYINPVTGEQYFLSTDKNGNNPFWIMNFNKSNNEVDRFVGSFSFNFKPTSWLSFSDNVGGDIYTEKRYTNTRKGSAGNINGNFTNTDLFYRQLNNDFLVTLEKNDLINDLGIKLILGNNINDREFRSTVVQATDLTIDQLYTYTNAASKNPTLDYTNRRLIGVFGDLGFSYKNIAYLNITGRNDWTSTLPIENRSYFYPSVSGSFIFSEFMKNISWLDYGKFRASWASVGSDVAPYSLDFLYTPVSTVFMQYVGSTTTVFPFSPINTAFAGPRILPNANLKPQRQNSFEVGTDLRFLKGRVGLGLTYYSTITKDQIVDIDVPISTGYFANSVNVGALSNKGVEVDLNLTPVKSRDFTWAVDVNFSKNKQKVDDLGPNLKVYSLASGWSGLQIKAAPGQSFGLYGTKWERDSAGNFVINPNSGLRQVKTDQRLGNIYPDWTMGINNTFTYKGISLSGLIDIRQGGVFYSGTVASLRSSGLAKETLENREKIFVDKGVVLDANTNKYVTNTVPVQSMQDFWGWYSAVANTEGNVFDASFVKLREVRIAYALPARVLAKTFIKGAEFGIEGRNLAIIKDHVPHVDPELNFFGAGSVGEGVEFNSVPSTRSVGVNVRLSF